MKTVQSRLIELFETEPQSLSYSDLVLVFKFNYPGQLFSNEECIFFPGSVYVSNGLRLVVCENGDSYLISGDRVHFLGKD